jgi:hypothetical protein
MAMPAWVSEVGVASSAAIALLAVFGERLRATVFRPQLRLSLTSNLGERTIVGEVETKEGGSVSTRRFDTRHYHIKVTNLAVWPTANEVQIYLTSFDILAPGGRSEVKYSGALPLNWRYQTERDSPHRNTRTLGAHSLIEADLFYVCQDYIQLTPMFVPNNLASRMIGAQHFWLTVVARGLNGESKPLCLRCEWDGQWHLDDIAMSEHLKITII